MPGVEEVVGDKDFDGDRLREGCVERDVNPDIPLKANRAPERWAFDAEGYRERNRVEKMYGKPRGTRSSKEPTLACSTSPPASSAYGSNKSRGMSTRPGKPARI